VACKKLKIDFLLLPAQQIDLTDIYSQIISENRDNDCQPNRSLRSSYTQGEKHKNDTIDIPKMAAESYQGKINGIEHKFDTHKDYNGILARQNANYTDAE